MKTLTAKEIFIKHWIKKVGSLPDETTLYHMQYAIDAITEASQHLATSIEKEGDVENAWTEFKEENKYMSFIFSPESFKGGFRKGLSLQDRREKWISVERVICACNYYNDGSKEHNLPINLEVGFVICGHRHHNCISTFAQMVGFPYSAESHLLQQTEVQGFLTNTNRFVTRLEALEIAKKANQIITGEGNSSLGLFSEDLY